MVVVALTVFAFVLAQVGSLAWTRRRTGLDVAFVPGLVFTAQGLAVVVGGLLGVLPQSAWAVVVVGLALLACLNASADGLAAEDRLKAPPLLSAPPAPATPGPPRSAEADAALYERCMKLAREDAAAGRKEAQDWQESGGGHPADHCFAVALIGLRQYKEAAGRLEALPWAVLCVQDAGRR